MVLPVEIQLRTIAMDMWASLEHELRYKSDRRFTDEDAARLRLCSDAISEIDREMQDIYQSRSITHRPLHCLLPPTRRGYFLARKVKMRATKTQADVV